MRVDEPCGMSLKTVPLNRLNCAHSSYEAMGIALPEADIQ